MEARLVDPSGGKKEPIFDPFGEAGLQPASVENLPEKNAGPEGSCLPLYASFSVDCIRYPAKLASSRDLAITFSNMKGEGLIATNISGQVDPFIIFEAGFIEKGVRTSVLKNVRINHAPVIH